MSKFRIGDKVTPKETGPWEVDYSSFDFKSAKVIPRFGEIYTVAFVAEMLGYWCFGIEEFGTHPSGKYDEFRQCDFDKVVSDRVLSEELKSVPEPFTI